MKRLSFISRFMNARKLRNSKIQVYKNPRNHSLRDKLKKELSEYDKRIIEIMKNLIEVQIVKIRAGVAKPNNWFGSIYKNAYQTSIQNSIDWHGSELQQVLKEKKEKEEVYTKLFENKIKHRLKKFLMKLLFFSGILFVILILLLGLLSLIYILPVIIFLLVIVAVLNKRNYR